MNEGVMGPVPVGFQGFGCAAYEVNELDYGEMFVDGQPRRNGGE